MGDGNQHWPSCKMHICAMLASTGSKLPMAPCPGGPGGVGPHPHPRHSQCGPPQHSHGPNNGSSGHNTGTVTGGGGNSTPNRGPPCPNYHRIRRPSSKSLLSVRTSDLSVSGSPSGQMSTTNMDGLHTPAFLSWRKLQLSRAKLKASSKTSALLSGFAMVAMVEVQLDTDKKIPSEMLVAFAVCTTLLVAVHMLALMISTCILPNIEAVCNMHSISLVHESPHERLHWYIETAWAFSTLLGLLLFLVEIALLCWVKFYNHSQMAAWSASVLLVPVLIVFLGFAVHFYRSLVTHKYEVTASGIRELELLKEQIETGDMEGRINAANGVNGLMSSTQIV